MKPGAISSTWCVTMIIEGAIRVAGEAAEAAYEVLAAAEVEAGGGLVEEQQLGVGHHGAGDEGALALALGEGAELAVQVLGHAEAVEEGAGALLVDRPRSPRASWRSCRTRR